MATTTRILDANVNGTVYTTNANDALEALDTCHSGTTAPTDEVANGKFWLDTSTTPSVLKVYDNAGWNVVYSGRGDLTVAGTVNATALTGNGSGITGVATAAQGTLADSAVQPNDSPTFGVVTATSYAGDGSALTGIPLPPSQTTAVWEAGTDTTESVISAAKVAAAVDARSGGGIGTGQTWQDVIGSRVNITTYQNTTGLPIQVAISSSFGTGPRGFFVSSDNITFLDLVDANTTPAQMAFIVPVDHYYKINKGTGTLYTWKELR